MTDKPYILYGMMASLYTAKVRAYMRFHGVNFVERAAGLPEFTQNIVPKVQRWIIPTVVTPEDHIIQDGTVILDYLNQEEPNKGSIHPDTPVLQSIAHLFELFGGEGLLRPAMHYRWNFDEANLDFLKLAFRDVLPPNLSTEEQEGFFLHASGRMRKATIQFGVKDENQKDVEDSYDEFLTYIEAHLTNHPFLLGGRPTIADYGLFGPLFAHLGRDPKPLSIMQKKAPHLFQWVERMNAPAGNENHLYISSKGDLFSDDAIPDTLIKLMAYVAEEYLPEITSHVGFANDWLEKNTHIESGTSGLDNPSKRSIGYASFDWRGKTNSSAVMLYRFYLLQRLTDYFGDLSAEGQRPVCDIFSKSNLTSILTLKTQRRIIRKECLEVWK
ncbi:glutathione S-transferase family protein [Temperatibacter marinus]|uniref:Glutathione S-transferase family protein n=1 Tax=Temperatibacter marinus TaxID=1456591 RepID=A0AA52EHQ3_9PROT|nr:glutathione S-transferase family protein [Temperatibacter marinus]WND02995.1 glutathione S-transferase family protein [Temperatibacter marinus]